MERLSQTKSHFLTNPFLDYYFSSHQTESTFPLSKDNDNDCISIPTNRLTFFGHSCALALPPSVLERAVPFTSFAGRSPPKVSQKERLQTAYFVNKAVQTRIPVYLPILKRNKAKEVHVRLILCNFNQPDFSAGGCPRDSTQIQFLQDESKIEEDMDGQDHVGPKQSADSSPKLLRESPQGEEESRKSILDSFPFFDADSSDEVLREIPLRPIMTGDTSRPIFYTTVQHHKYLNIQGDKLPVHHLHS